ncbi:MAG: hypothetical protein AAF960_12070 [Bacteroidota bacterium]
MQDLAIVKLKVIEWLTKIDDLETILKIVAIKENRENLEVEVSFPKLTKEDLLKRAEASNADIEKGDFEDIESIEKELW